MKRASTAKKTTNQQKHKQNIALLNMFNSILMASTNTEIYQSQYTFNSHTLINTTQHKTINMNNKSKIIERKNNNTRPQTPGKVQELLQQNKNSMQMFQINMSAQRKALRPKTSVMSARVHRSPSANNDNKNQQIQRQDSQIIYKNEVNRKYYSNSLQKQKIIDYKIIQADTFIQKVQNKLPKSICSTKSIGKVCAYGVNCYKMLTSSQISQGRVLIIANITKTNKLQTMTSLYSIFYSNKSIIYVQYIRQHFQQEIAKKLQICPTLAITKQIIQNCLHNIQNKFCDMYRMGKKKNQSLMMSITNSFGLSYAMVFVRNNEIVICTKGSCDVKISFGYGSRLQGQHGSGSGNGSMNVRVLNREQIQNIDYIALISDGINRRDTLHNNSHINNSHIINNNNSEYDYNREQATSVNVHGSGWLQAQIWQILLKNIRYKIQYKTDEYNNNNIALNIHQQIGICIDNLYRILTKAMTYKNMSIIMLAFNISGIDGFAILYQQIYQQQQQQQQYNEQSIN